MDERRERASCAGRQETPADQQRGGQPPRPSRASKPNSAGTGSGAGGGLISRYGANDAGAATPQQPTQQPPSSAQAQAGGGGNGGGLLSRARAQSGAKSKAQPAGTAGASGGRQPLRTLAGQAKRLGNTIRRATSDAPDARAPRAGEWKASDFDARQLEEWDRYEAVPFELPPDPDDSGERYAAGRNDRRRNRSGRHDGWDEDIDWDDNWDGGWETGSWDVEWATGLHNSLENGDGWGDDDEWDAQQGDAWQPGAAFAGQAGQWGGGARSSAPDASYTMAQLGAVTAVNGAAPLTRRARVRLLTKRRPGAAAMLMFFVLGFLLTCCAPMIPVLRLGYDTYDAARHVSNLQKILAGGSSQLLNTTTLKEAQTEVDGLEHDLYEINGVVSVVGAPFGAVSSTMRNYQLLVRMGYDLTAAGDEALQVAQTVLTPLSGGALAASTTPGLQPADIQLARNLLADAQARIADALSVYQNINQNALPSQLKPGSKYGKLLALLPVANNAIGELKTLLDAAPALLGIGQPAYYLLVAMDDTELRPGGGFQGNYGILEIDGGKQSASRPLSLQNTYDLDTAYATAHAETPPPGCGHTTPEPPEYYWWWPVRCINQYGWGLRDSNLSPDFPTNAQTAIQIVQDAHEVPNNGKLQGEVAFTPGLIADLLQATGSLPMPEYKVTITPQNLRYYIHEFQLGAHQQAGQDRKQFTHDLASKLLVRIKTLHGAALKPIFKIAEDAIKSKDLQIYLADPRGELILRQLGLASSINTGNLDGFFVVDTNFGGNKANAFVTEHQTDVVTLLPGGGALHRLEISITYNKQGSVYSPFSQDYQDMQRTYLPGDASILGWSGFNPSALSATGCGLGGLATFNTDCSYDHGIFGVSTNSDVAGRTMVMGPVTVLCGEYASVINIYSGMTEDADCISHSIPHTVNIFLSWYSPNAYMANANGHGTYSELIEKQPGANDTLTVYIASGHNTSPTVVSDTGTFASLLQGAKKVYDKPLTTNTPITYSF